MSALALSAFLQQNTNRHQHNQNHSDEVNVDMSHHSFLDCESGVHVPFVVKLPLKYCSTTATVEGLTRTDSDSVYELV